MPSQPPPARYRVVERGRRLEVIDTLSGEPAGASAPSSQQTPRRPARGFTEELSRLFDPLAAGGLIARTGFDGRAILTTRRWFDDKAPRRLSLDPGTASRIDRARSLAIGAGVILLLGAMAQPMLAALVLPLAAPRVRAALRRALTGWLDRLDPAG